MKIISLHLRLRELIEKKSERDKIKFTSAQLANALCMPRSMITKLTHSDETKRVINPRIDTLLKIIDFFKSDGFDITLEDLLGSTKKINISKQLEIPAYINKIPIYSFDQENKNQIGYIEVKTPTTAKNIFALSTSKVVHPFFKKGSIFIIDPDQYPKNDMLVATYSKNTDEIHINKYFCEKNKKWLESIDIKKIQSNFSAANMIGVVIQINIKT